MKLNKITKILTVILCIVLVFGCINAFRGRDNKTQPVDGTTATTTTTKSGYTEANLLCAGDNLIHSAIYKQAQSRAGGSGYDFSYSYENVADIVASADIAFLNQETIMAGSKPLSAYPMFNSPPELLDEMIEIGFDVFNQATNHTMDKYVSGALENYELYQGRENVILTGLHKTWDDMFIPQTIIKNDITFSFMGFAEHLNGLRVPEDSDLGLVYLTDTRHTKEELYDTMQKMIDAGKNASDVVCVSMHWWDENITTPDESQKEIAQKLVDMGADIIIGTGPHVLQPIEYLERDDGSKALVIWSLGNFISTQKDKPNLLGGFADITVRKDYATGEITISDISFIPTITHYNAGPSNIRIIPFKDYNESLASSHARGLTYSYIKEFYEDMFGDYLSID